jgi:ectoine hydroxylase-related dioxygenase (phytanoyl-CoA dioxygenase family)
MGDRLNLQGYELRTLGYAVLPGALGEGEVTALARRIDELLTEEDARWGADRLTAIGQRGALRNLADRGPEFERLLGTPVLHELAADLVSPEYQLHSYDGLVLQHGTGRYPWDFHTDLLGLCGVAFPAAITPGVNWLVAVDGSGPDNGATWLVPGSHRCVVRDPDPYELAELAVQPSLRPGDMLAFDARIWHCAGHNGSGQARRLIKVEFVQPWLRPQLEYARSIRQQVLGRLTPQARRSIGAPPPASIEEFWLAAEGRP